MQNTAAKKYTIATVGKVEGIAWFTRMKEGVKRFQADTGHEISMVSPPKADNDLYVQIVEDIVKRGVDALCVVPIFPKALEMVLRKARSQGIVVISHEASELRNVDYNLEAFDNVSYGAHLMDHLAQYMGAKGYYAVFVGNLTCTSHSEWANAAIERQKEKYPRMALAAKRIEDHDDTAIAYAKTQELLKTCPDLGGILGCAMTTVPGASQAVEEGRRQDDIVVLGSCLVSACKLYLANGSAKMISFWDPADAGYLMNKLAVMALEGKIVSDGMDLGVPGYQKIKLVGKVAYGTAWIDVTKDNMARYQF